MERKKQAFEDAAEKRQNQGEKSIVVRPLAQTIKHTHAKTVRQNQVRKSIVVKPLAPAIKHTHTKVVRQNQVKQSVIATPLATTIEYTHTKVVQPNHHSLQKNRIILGDQQNYFADIYRMLRTKVLQSMRQNNWRTLGITSPNPGEGKTVTSINLAISLARELNQTVLLVDFDLRCPNIHHCFGLDNETGLSDYIGGQATIEDVFINPGVARLVLLPGREPIHHSSDILSSPQFLALIEEVKTRYADRIVLFDLPPLLLLDDALTLAPFIDAFLLVIEDGVTDEDDLRSAHKMLAETNIIGSVLNKLKDLPKKGYKYYGR